MVWMVRRVVTWPRGPGPGRRPRPAGPQPAPGATDSVDVGVETTACGANAPPGPAGRGSREGATRACQFLFRSVEGWVGHLGRRPVPGRGTTKAVTRGHRRELLPGRAYRPGRPRVAMEVSWVTSPEKRAFVHTAPMGSEMAARLVMRSMVHLLRRVSVGHVRRTLRRPIVPRKHPLQDVRASRESWPTAPVGRWSRGA